MLYNHFKSAGRSLLKKRRYSLINIVGLAVGMAVAILIGLWIYDEISYNHSHYNYEHIAEVYRRNTEPLEQKTFSSNGLPQPVAKVLTDKYGHFFKHVTLIWWDAPYTIQAGENSWTKTGQFIENGVIDMFSLNMLRGSKESLDDPRAIIISESTAKTLFQDQDPVNQPVKLNGEMDVTVTGVYEDIAANSIFGHIQFFGNFAGLKTSKLNLKDNENNWGNTAYRIFVQTADNISLEQAGAAITDLYLNDSPEPVAQYSKKYQTQVWLHPMKDWHLYSEFKDGYPAGGRITYVRLFALVGAFVLLLACINFMNLSTARSEKRAKEVGIRKAIGAMRSQLIDQFLSESLVATFLALILALLLIAITLSPFNDLADKSIRFPLANPYFWMACLGFLLLTSFLSGLYPAFYLSSFQPVKVLKGTSRVGRYAALPRKILVIVQVAVSVILSIGTIVVYQQIKFAQERPVGYDKQGLIRIPVHDADLEKNKWLLKDELLAGGAAVQVGFASSPVTAIWDNWGGFTWRGKNPEAESNFTVTWVNEDYGKAIRWKLLQGRDFSKDFGTDAESVIINKAAANYMGLEHPVGELVTLQGSNQRRQIIGVVDDVVATSPYEPVSAGFYWLATANPEVLGQMLIRLKPELSARDALAKIESMQNKLAPVAPFEYSFVDDDYGIKFQAEQRIGKLALVFAILAIFISCLGLFGLSSFAAEQKTKEVGLRKVVGASVFNIWAMLSKEFMLLVLIAFVLAAPVASYFLQQWLSTFQYRTYLNPFVFALAGGGALFITLTTVSFHSIKAAVASPMKSLRSE